MDGRNWLTPDYTLLRVRETQNAGQRAKSRMVCRRGLRFTDSFPESYQTDEKRVPRHLPAYRTEGQKEDANGPFAEARQR